MYSFAKLSDTWPRVLAPYEWNDDAYDNNYAKVTNLKTQNSNLKILLAVGGWTHGVAKFRDMAATATTREQFISHAITFLRDRNFDGLDLDWEFPVAEDKENFASLCQVSLYNLAVSFRFQMVSSPVMVWKLYKELDNAWPRHDHVKN